MRPHHLRLSAFGPFAGTVEVDLDDLGAGGLFLLHGPTGAGKTTLLDAMCFALFGQVPGPRGVKRLRSDHADPGLRSEVRLDLTVAGRRLRVTRSPSYERAKKRGTGVAVEKPTLRVEERLAGSWSTWSERPDEAGDLLADLVGMTAAQFTQVVLLPQGAFATFLHAGAQERGALLQQLFATDRFGTVEGWLAERARLLTDRLRERSGQLQSLLARVAQAADLEAPETVDLGWYDAVLATLDDGLALAQGDAVAASAAADAAEREHRAEQQLAEHASRRAAALDRLAAAHDRGTDVEAVRAALAAAAEAAPLLPFVDRAERAAAAVATGSADPALLRSAAAAERLRVGRLEELAPVADRVAGATRQLGELAADLAVATAQEQALTMLRQQLPTLRAEALAARDLAAAARQQLPTAEATASRLTDALADAQRATELEHALAAARTAELGAREAAVAAGERRNAVHDALVAGQAARLAQLLVDGEPCAVCGASEHPTPATGGLAVPDDTEVDAADATAESTQQARAAAGATVAGLDAELGAVLARLAETDRAALPATVADAASEVERLRLEAAVLPDAEAALGGIDARSSQADIDAATVSQRLQAMQDLRQRAAADLDADSARLAAALGDAPDLSAALAAATARACELDAAAAAADEAAGLAATASAAAAELADALAGSTFADAGAVRAAALTAAAVRQHGEVVAAYDRELAAAGAAPELAVAAGTTATQTADTAATGALLAERLADRDRVAAAVAVLADRRSQVAGLGPALRAATAAIAPLLAEHDETAGLAALVRGDNGRGMRLSTYVLAARLEQVAAAASGRLLQMTDGRYALRHTDVRADRRRQGGLGLVVYDGWTGTERDTGTLSGGETFSASLALALGLADVVTAEAGGAPIEALFVDEGFGSLDEDALEEVLDVLDGLRAGGRVVGVVSHVTDLQRRIPAQLHVVKTPRGSTLRRAG